MLSFEYYQSIFNQNEQKLEKIKLIIVKDFKKMEHAFFEANTIHNLQLMQMELHKMAPIVSNLKFTELSILFEKYKKLMEYDDDIQFLNAELKSHLSKIYSFLE